MVYIDKNSRGLSNGQKNVLIVGQNIPRRKVIIKGDRDTGA
jgi:hypothetical protein